MAEKKPLPPGVPEAQTPIPGGTEDIGPPPKFGTGKPADPEGDVPRVIDPLERAPKGLIRFKIRCNNYHPQKTRYILARTEDEARAEFMKANGLDKHIAKLKKINTPNLVEADLVVTQLPD